MCAEGGFHGVVLRCASCRSLTVAVVHIEDILSKNRTQVHCLIPFAPSKVIASSTRSPMVATGESYTKS